MVLHPYLAYKPSGIPWLGDMPAHWDVAACRLAVSQDGPAGARH